MKLKKGLTGSVTLQDINKMGIFKRTDQPQFVYHMTDETSATQILKDGAVNSKDDFMNFFFINPADIPVYIVLTGADNGRKYFDFDGRVHTAEPLNHNKTVVLKLKPRFIEPLYWFKEKPQKVTAQNNQSALDIEKAQRKQNVFANIRVCHFGGFKFDRDEIEIIPLTEIDKKYSYPTIDEI